MDASSLQVLCNAGHSERRLSSEEPESLEGLIKSDQSLSESEATFVQSSTADPSSV